MIDRPEWWLMGLSGRLYQVSFTKLEFTLHCDGCIQYHSLKSSQRLWPILDLKRGFSWFCAIKPVHVHHNNHCMCYFAAFTFAFMTFCTGTENSTHPTRSRWSNHSGETL